MSNSITAATNGVVVVTSVHPIEKVMDIAERSPQPKSLGQSVSGVLDSFRKGQPKALGTVQIMIGLVMLLLGIVMASSSRPDNIGVLSGIFAWGSIIFIIAGSITVAADNHLTPCLVKGSLGINVIAAFIALICIILYSTDTAGVMLFNTCKYQGPNNNPSYQGPNNIPSNPGTPQNNPSNPGNIPSHSDDSDDSSHNEGHRSIDSLSPSSDCLQYWKRSSGISGVLVILSLLEFIVCICVSSFACKAVCHCCCCHTAEKLHMAGHPISVPDDVKVIPSNAAFSPDYEAGKNAKDLEGAGGDTGFYQNDQPPDYTSIFR